MLIVALVLALIGLGALVLAVVTSNAMIAWVCIVASVIGVVLLIVDAVRDRSKGDAGESSTVPGDSDDELESEYVEDYPDEASVAEQYDADQFDADQFDADQFPADDTDAVPADDTVAVDVESGREPGRDVGDGDGDEESPKN